MKFFKKKDKPKKDGSGSNASALGFANKNGRHGFNRSGREYQQPFGNPPHGDFRDGDGRHSSTHPNTRFQPKATRRSALALASLPAPILERIFAFVCPHAQDESYESQEQSSIEDACMLCDLRDLAHCVAAGRRWRAEGLKLLFVPLPFLPPSSLPFV
jgi:hypothetical protein